MEDRSLFIEFNDPELPREEFLNLFRQHVRPFIKREWGLEYALREITKNFYDHANGKGCIRIVIQGSLIIWEAYDFGPGHPDESIKTIEDAVDHAKRFGSSKKIPNVNAGGGLFTLTGTLNALKQKHPDSVWSATVVGRFHYKGTYTSKVLLGSR